MALISAAQCDGTVHIGWDFRVPAGQVWRCLTATESLRLWLGEVKSGEFAVGSELVIDHGEGAVSRSMVQDLHPGVSFTMTWDFPEEPESVVAVQLAERAEREGCELRLTHRDLGELASSYSPGWVTHLLYLEAAITGTPLPQNMFWPICTTIGQCGGTDAAATPCT